MGKSIIRHGDDYCAKFVRDHYPRILASELIDRQFSISSSANTCIYNSLIEVSILIRPASKQI
jgi:hypothetical protein